MHNKTLSYIVFSVILIMASFLVGCSGGSSANHTDEQR